MQWTSEGGFSDASDNSSDPWIPTNDDADVINVEVSPQLIHLILTNILRVRTYVCTHVFFQRFLHQDSSDFNILKSFAILSDLKQSAGALQFGEYDTVVANANIFSFLRTHEGEDRRVFLTQQH